MLNQIISIARNAFFESIRQPIVFILLVAATLLLLLASPLSAFTMENDQRMLLDIGLATVFMIGMLLAIFVASNVLGQEIRNKTTLTIVSKPVGRPTFVIGKFIGAGFAVTLATLYVSLVFLLVEQQEVFQTVRVPIHLPVFLFGILTFIIGTAVAVWCNYFYGFVFSSTWICVTTPLLAISYLLVLNFSPDFSLQPMWVAFKPDIWKAVIAVLVSVLILGAVAIAFSTRLTQLGTLIATCLVFFIGMMSDAWFGRPMYEIEQHWLDRAKNAGQVETVDRVRVMHKSNGDIEEVVTETLQPLAGTSLATYAIGSEYYKWASCKVAYSVIPNFQVLWLTDALTQENIIPTGYLLKISGYGALYIIGALSCGIILFQRREVS
jgi:ABC-2 type transport system permease protein